MNLQGDVHVWTEGDKARATLTLTAPEGQVVIAAEASLEAARSYVERMLADRGEDVSGVGDDRLGELTDQVGRFRALSLLRKVAPAMFLPAGVLTVAAARRLARRRRNRKRARRPMMPLRGRRPGPAPEEPLPAEPGPEPEGEPEDEERYEEEDASSNEYEPEDDEGMPAERYAAAGIGAGQGALPAAALAASPQLQAGAALLSAAKVSPKAARRVAGIFRRARGGNPTARRQARVLMAAQRAEKQQGEALRELVKHGTEPAPSGPLSPSSRLPPLLPALPGASSSSPLLAIPSTSTSTRPDHGVFSTWRRGIV